MARSSTATNVDVEFRRTLRAQVEASDPGASVWVSANAGTGKTHVLTMRVLRLLLSGTSPEKILCLTYTKAAAAEMSKRVFDKLAEWVTASPTQLGTALADLMSRKPAKDELLRARTLFARAIETPGGLKVQTIHAFSERLLQRFPLEAGVPPGFVILDDATARELKREAIDDVLAGATRDSSGELGRALGTAIAYAAEDHFDDVLSDALLHRRWLAEIPRLEHAGFEGFAAFGALLKENFGVRADATRASLAAEMSGLVGDAGLKRLKGVLAEGGVSDQKLAAVLSEALGAADAAHKSSLLAAYFLTGKAAPRKSLMSKALQETYPDIDAQMQRAQHKFFTLYREAQGMDVVAATLALSRLADGVLQSYTTAKDRRAALDFDDLIEKTASLLRTGGSAEWVLFKLDGGIDHILVDESQDTSPQQWDIIAGLAEEFFVGSGAREEPRSLFAVGDEKQSIYSFQGAVPQTFDTRGKEFALRAADAGVRWRRIPLNVSFRTVAPVLDVVDAVFADEVRTPGVPVGVEGIRHIAKRAGQSGLIEIWPTEVHEEQVAADAWLPLEDAASEAPSLRLANRIADTIRDWCDNGEILQSENRPIEPGDILILVRKRDPFAGPMVGALKARGIAVAGADRIQLSSQIAVQDLMALGDFLTLPEDDLSLATVLKSPLFGFDDDALLAIAPGRKGTLWKALLDQAQADAKFADAAETLKRWRRAADFSPPFEFFASLLDRDGGRAKLLSRLGPDAADAIDEFLNLAVSYDDGAPPSLTGFLAWLRTTVREIKRDMEHGRNEVRVMTVHGAKGLEAPIVFLPDTCSATTAATRRGRPIAVHDFKRPESFPAPFVWPVKGTSGLEAIAGANSALEAAERNERNRLLYVAMTRARDRLYIAGFEGKRGRERGCWYDTISQALGDMLETGTDARGQLVRRIVSQQSAPHDMPKVDLSQREGGLTLPDWAYAPARREPQLTIPLAPSRLAPYEMDETGEPSPNPPRASGLDEPYASPLGGTSGQNRFLRGLLTHALLQYLPDVDPAVWPKAAKAFVAKRGRGLSGRVQSSIVSETLAVLGHAEFAPLFGPESRAEVPIVAEVPRPKGRGPALKLAGQIDRLAVTQEAVYVVDYKTNRPPPRKVAEVADVYLFQLAAYALALEQIFPGRAIRAALLWTDGPRLMEIPGKLLNDFKGRLWDVDPGSLDA